MKIWYDLTDIYNWQGNFTGVQRVIYNLGKNLEKTMPDTHFFIYQSGVFNEVSFNQLEERLKQINEAAEKARLSKDTKARLSYIQHRAVLELKNSVRGTKAEPYLRATYVRARKAYRQARSGRSLHHNISHSSLFETGDIVFISGGNWLVRNYAEDLLAAKKAIDFKLVHLVNDIIALRNPGLTNPGARKIIGSYFDKIFNGCDALVAISESTKQDIEWYAKENKLNQPPVYLIKLGDNIELEAGQGKAQKPDADIPKPFVLTVGTLEIRKNYRILYYVYKLAKQQNVELPHLIISGRKGWMNEETYFLLTKDADVKDKITILKDVTDDGLKWLYDNCEFTIFPSMYEGWGLPVAESLKHGKCCIAGNVSSMPEVGGNLVKYVSPYDPASMVKAMAELSQPAVRRKMETKIKAEYKPQTWQQTAEEVSQILNKAGTD